MRPINLIKQANVWFEKERFREAQVFCFFIYSWVILNAFTLLPHHRYFWGDLSWIQKLPISEPTLLNRTIGILSVDSMEPFYLGFLFAQVFFSVVRIMGRLPMLSSFIVWLATLVLDHRAFTIIDGGNNLMHIILFFAIFLFPDSENSGGVFSGVKRYSTNSAIILSRIQLCVVYFVAGHLKMTGEYWTNGMAFYYVFGVDEYSLPLLNNLVKGFPLLSVLASYSTIFFQITFPFLIWFRGARPSLFLFGGLMHVGIALGMGLLTFGLAMVSCYAVFLAPDQVNEYYRYFEGIKKFFIRLKMSLLAFRLEKAYWYNHEN